MSSFQLELFSDGDVIMVPDTSGQRFIAPVSDDLSSSCVCVSFDRVLVHCGHSWTMTNTSLVALEATQRETVTKLRAIYKNERATRRFRVEFIRTLVDEVCRMRILDHLFVLDPSLRSGLVFGVSPTATFSRTKSNAKKWRDNDAQAHEVSRCRKGAGSNAPAPLKLLMLFF